uniref:C3H1-type domain-containing protein n=1 Tax=Compsopogon caeruleus TaxID=31354 RepID=A0A7S1TFZ5_9RHOD|mmetsp:Transcript_5624/g.11266  ORF Transcript_5624/g.11266 Transcript_5624/m.11266 type:complete len:225 (+) Transcript_5624:320-994(+)|eukprot:CAMPEP_0184686302 /NCGR_PEP_ID=MMETSP0312-20130426/21962_1 /TAXON_ID=31354 /ORGANISM="Compsopogon coeruleus, Strain SAG 36.94" /LENGTH=224 /DNA_ID=CAMNT_0027141245 /DNA_START=267 /DNA_END=941 /DNA_ORIENTATION=-
MEDVANKIRNLEEEDMSKLRNIIEEFLCRKEESLKGEASCSQPSISDCSSDSWSNGSASPRVGAHDDDQEGQHAGLGKNDLFKTELCRTFMETGRCRYGLKCQFAHGTEELRPVKRHPKYKTKLCRNFVQSGNCPYGTRCRFIHGATNEFSIQESQPYRPIAAPKLPGAFPFNAEEQTWSLSVFSALDSRSDSELSSEAVECDGHYDPFYGINRLASLLELDSN